MNERLKELVKQADLFWSERDGRWHLYDDSHDLERFADLVRQDERERIKQENQRCYVESEKYRSQK